MIIKVTSTGNNRAIYVLIDKIVAFRRVPTSSYSYTALQTVEGIFEVNESPEEITALITAAPR